MASRKPAGAPRATGPDEARRTTRGHQARPRGTPPGTAKALGQVPSNNGHGLPQTRAASTTRNEPRHRNRCQATPNPHTTNGSQEWRGTSGARTQAHAQPDTPARSGGARPKPKPEHTHAHPNTPARSGRAQPKPEPKHAHPSQEWRGTSGAGTQTHTPEHDSQERRSTRAQTAHPSQEWQGTSRVRTQAHTEPVQPSQEWRGAGETRAQAHTPTPHTPASSGRVQAERTHKHTHTQIPQPRVAGRSRNLSPSTHSHSAHPSQEWRGAAETRAQAHTPTPHTSARCGGVQAERAHKHAHTSTPARSGGAQPKPNPKHTYPHGTPQPGVAGYERIAHTSTHTPQHPSQEWRGAAETRAKAHTCTTHTPARRRGAQRKPGPKHTRPHRAPKPGVAGSKRGAYTNTHSPTPQQGVAGRSRNPSPTTHTDTAHLSQEWQGTSGSHTQAHTQPNTPARSGRAQRKPEPKHTHAQRTPEPGLAGRSRNPSPSTQAHTAHPSQEWRGPSGAHTQTRTPQHSSKEWRGEAETRVQAHTPTQHTPARSGGLQAERAHKHTQT